MLQTKYITLDEFKEYTQIDLSEIDEGANPSTTGASFLYRLERRMETLIDVECFRNVQRLYPQFNDFQKQCYKIALCEQALWIFQNSDISVDSGYDMEKGIIVALEQLEKLTLAPNAKRELQRCGVWSKKLHMSDWAGSFWW